MAMTYGDRFEILPVGRGEHEAEQLAMPLHLTVTCSPKHGPDRTVDAAKRLRALGHGVTAHLAARMVRDPSHLDTLLRGLAEAGVDDIFLIGGDADAPQGLYTGAVDLLPLVAQHRLRPRTIGIAGYPEGHPLISDEELDRALLEKSRLADYVTTQMCFDPDAVRAFVMRQRERGIALPVLIGMAGKVARRRLIDLSVRIGVGPSLAFVRKQRGLRSLIARGSTADTLYDALAPMRDDPELNIAGLHFFTFNQLIETWEWQLAKQSQKGASKESVAGNYVHPEESTA
jgi:methylenetetrahydrofolate reductase (NADPH)